MRLGSVVSAIAVLGLASGLALPTGAQTVPEVATIVVNSLPIALLGDGPTLTRVIYFENFSIRKELVGNQPFDVEVPVNDLSTIDPNRPLQRIVAYSGSLNDGVQLQIRPVHAGGIYPINIYVGSVPAGERLEAVDKICAHTPSINDIDAQARRYFVCRQIVISTNSEDIVTFKALKGWWEANYVFSTARDAYIAADPDVLARVEAQLDATPISPRFLRVFKLDNLRREILEIKGRSLADYQSVGSFIKTGNLTKARLVYDAAVNTFENLSASYSVTVIDGITRARLAQDGAALEALELKAVNQ